MKSLSEALASAGLSRPVRPPGFCPACPGWLAGAGDSAQNAGGEVEPAGVTAGGVLVVAALAWILTIAQSGSTPAPDASAGVAATLAPARSASAGVDMPMGLGSLQSFATIWLVM